MLLNIIADTPWWMWVFFTSLMVIGFKMRHTQTVYLPVFFIVPTLITAFKFMGLIILLFKEGDSINFTVSLVLASWLIPGTLAGFLMTLKKPATFHKNNLSVTVAGSWKPLIAFVLLFLARYVSQFLILQQPNLFLRGAVIYGAEMVFYLTVAGIFWGRALCYTYRFCRA